MQSKNGHHPESNAFPADKMIPKAYLKYWDNPHGSVGRKLEKHRHIKRARRFFKNLIAKET